MSETNEQTREQGLDTDAQNLHAKLPKVISFEELARCGEEIWIENNGSLYRLRRTKQGKLILTK